MLREHSIFDLHFLSRDAPSLPACRWQDQEFSFCRLQGHADKKGMTPQNRIAPMSYAEHWAALATQIQGLRNAGELYARFQGYHQEDSYGAGAYLREQCGVVVQSLEAFRRDFGGSLPPPAIERLDHFLKTTLAQAAKDASTTQRGARGALVALAALEAEITFILSGRQEQIRARSERALLHLQRTVAVDEDASTKWKNALAKNEIACERLGSIHLLSHGIFAFKVDALGARTDLVFNEPPDDSLLTRGVEGLVLTEWKVASDAKSAAEAFRTARAQADLYRQGPLAGLELTGYRYLIAVSLEELPSGSIPPDDATSTGIVYRHVNIAVQPSVPSKAAKKASR